MTNRYLLLCLASLLALESFAQSTQTAKKRRCASMEVLNKKLQNASFKAKYKANLENLYKNSLANKSAKTAAFTDTIPVVIHIIMSNPALVTDAICQSQLDVLNEDYQGKNADTSRIPAAFKSKFGKGGITFMLAKTAPNGTPTTGIERRTNSISFTDATYTNGKHTATGGLDGWNPDKYFNVWVVAWIYGRLYCLGSRRRLPGP